MNEPDDKLHNEVISDQGSAAPRTALNSTEIRLAGGHTEELREVRDSVQSDWQQNEVYAKGPPTVSAPEEIEAAWRSSLPEQLRPVALRHGRALFVLCSHLINGVVGLRHIAAVAAQTKARLESLHARQAAQGFTSAMLSTHNIIDAAIAGLVESAVVARGFSREQIVECQTDITRANALAAAQPAKNAAGLILPAN